jgi:predicted RNA-binding Zn-ribbon protein involved in translation (DUF1610 family)
MKRKIVDYYENGIFKCRREVIDPNARDFLCNDCGYIWETKKKVGNPAICPKCRSQNIKEKSGIIESKETKDLKAKMEKIHFISKEGLKKVKEMLKEINKKDPKYKQLLSLKKFYEINIKNSQKTLS